MRILFLTLSDIKSIAERGIYMDLMSCFAEHGHEVYIISPLEKKLGKESCVEESGNLHLLKCKTGNLFNVGMIEKGISQVLLSRAYIKGINENWKDIKFDLILYSTPPITLVNVVKAVTRSTGARTYLLLKDIFPQNAIDIGLLRKSGVKGLIYRYFRQQEKKLYKISDYIGCMSKANVDYVLANNKEVDRSKVEICPNSIKISDAGDASVAFLPEQAGSSEEIQNYREEILGKYNIPAGKTVFIYGGNLGKPQGIPFAHECIKKAAKAHSFAHFVICGTGTESGIVKEAYEKEGTFTYIPGLPKAEYESLAAVCDVGLVFLDSRFSIPNFPSRMLSYMESSKPMLLYTDKNTDAGKLAEENGYGVSCISDDPENFVRAVKRLESEADRRKMGANGRKYLEEHFTVEKSYDIIIEHFKK